MALTIELPAPVEQQLRQDATQKGISLGNYLLQLLGTATALRKKNIKNKPLSESELLQKINLDISETEWATYRRLIGLRQAEKLTDQEYEVLLQLGDKIEQANTNRLQYLAQLAKLRQVSLDKLMIDLGIFPIAV